MAIDKDRIKEEYPSEDSPVRRPDSCEECPFEEILKYGIQNKVANLLEDIPEGGGPSREMIEEICGKKYNGVCNIKYEVERMNCGDYVLGQFEAARIFRRDINKHREKEGETVFIEELYDVINDWAAIRKGVYNKDGKPSSYAERWSEVWYASLDSQGRHTLTEVGIYKYVVSKNGRYKRLMKDLDELKKDEINRHENGIVLPN